MFWVFGFPLVLTVVLGLAFREKPANISHVAIVGSNAERFANAIRSSPVGSGAQTAVCSYDEARAGFRAGNYDLVLEIQGANVQYLYDASRPESVIALGSIDNTLQAAFGRQNALITSTVAVTEPGSRYIDFLIPGLLGMNLMNSGMWGIGFALVEMRQRKILKRFAATPMRRSDFLLALATSRIVVMIVEIVSLLGFGAWIFHMPVLGSIFAISVICVLGSLAFSALGLVVASRTGKIETANGLTNLVVMPMSILCGVFFSHERLPGVLQPIIRVLPLTALNDALRAVVLRGSPLSSELYSVGILMIWATVCFFLALKWFVWTA